MSIVKMPSQMLSMLVLRCFVPRLDEWLVCIIEKKTFPESMALLTTEVATERVRGKIEYKLLYIAATLRSNTCPCASSIRHIQPHTLCGRTQPYSSDEIQEVSAGLHNHNGIKIG